MGEPLTLELGSGFAFGPLGADDEQLVFVSGNQRSMAIEMVSSPPDLSRRRVLGRLPGSSLPAGTITVSRRRQKVYAAGAAGIWEFPLEGGAPSLVVGLPDLPAATREEAVAAYGASPHTDAWVAKKKSVPSYYWVLENDETNDQLLTLCGQDGALAHFVHVALDSRSISSQLPMPGFCADIQIDVKRGLILLPMIWSGPTLLDFTGRQVATWTAGSVGSSVLHGATIRPSDGAVVLAHRERGLLLWDWANDTSATLAADAARPHCSSRDEIFFMRTSAELWMLEAGSTPRLVAKALHEGSQGFEQSDSWIMEPLASKDGRFVLAQLTAVRKTRTAEVAVHDTVVVDLISRRVQHIPEFFQHTIAWF